MQGREFAQDYRHNFAVFNEDFRILSTGIACIGPAFVSSVMALILVFAVGAQAAWVDGTYEGWSDASDTGTQYAKVMCKAVNSR
ncbi:MAG TPA: hypothetical protein GX521_00885, partial [Firmicutes bacterium]|nr:hypothetical protein [Bacillota bacterium]